VQAEVLQIDRCMLWAGSFLMCRLDGGEISQAQRGGLPCRTLRASRNRGAHLGKVVLSRHKCIMLTHV